MLVEDTSHGSYAQFVLHLKWNSKAIIHTFLNIIIDELDKYLIKK